MYKGRCSHNNFLHVTQQNESVAFFNGRTFLFFGPSLAHYDFPGEELSARASTEFRNQLLSELLSELPFYQNFTSDGTQEFQKNPVFWAIFGSFHTRTSVDFGIDRAHELTSHRTSVRTSDRTHGPKVFLFLSHF